MLEKASPQAPRLSSWALRMFDVALTLAIAAPSIHMLRRESVGPPGAAAMAFALALPLMWRRRAPAAVFAVISAVAFLQWLFMGPAIADVALLVAFYSVAARESRRTTLAAAAVLGFGVLLAALRWTPGPRSGAGDAVLTFVFLSGLVMAAGLVGTNLRTRRAYLAALEERNEQLTRDRDQQTQLAAAAERARIARDMHDVVAHNLSVMIALADGASLTAISDPARAANAMGQVSATGRQALTEMRRLLGVLRDDSPAALAPQPGIADIDELLAQVRLTGLRGELVSDGQPSALQPGLQLTVYRLVQEALTNTLKHAVGANTATVRLRFRRDRLDVEIADDGDAPAPASDIVRGHGITGMRERAAAYGGVVEAGPGPVGGWRVKAAFDLTARAS